MQNCELQYTSLWMSLARWCHCSYMSTLDLILFCNIPDMRASWLNLLRQMVSSHSGIPMPSCRCGSTGGISGTIPIGDRPTFPGRRRHRVTLLSAHQASPPYKRESLVRLPADIIFKFQVHPTSLWTVCNTFKDTSTAKESTRSIEVEVAERLIIKW